jgi:hypothetical protein
MPSLLLTAASGAPFPLVSGNLWSGQGFKPYSQVRLYLDRSASGNAYISTSGNATVTSGGFLLSGQNQDAMALAPAGRLEYPRLVFVSGQLNLFATCDAAASGQARLYFEIF